LPSGKIIVLPISSFATIGVVSNTEQNKIVLGKAGVSRLKGRRPITRGIAMNPIDHPHGGRTNGGRPSCTP
jgi:large subunit ribosomal protein L2